LLSSIAAAQGQLKHLTQGPVNLLRHAHCT
jgi:hypothetical protein